MPDRPVHCNELEPAGVAQTFFPERPPFHHKDLHTRAEGFRESWAIEFPTASRFQITVYGAQRPDDVDPRALIGDAIHSFFQFRRQLSRREPYHLI